MQFEVAVERREMRSILPNSTLRLDTYNHSNSRMRIVCVVLGVHEHEGRHYR